MNKYFASVIVLILFFPKIYAQEDSIFSIGLSSQTSIGGAGYYKENATDDVLPLLTCVYRSGQFHTIGESSKGLFCPQLPMQYAVSELNHSWTGKSMNYTSANYNLNVEIRNTLPGPLFTTTGKSIFMRWMIRNEPRTLIGLQSGEKWGPKGVSSTNDQVFLANSSAQPTLIIVSQPLDKIVITSNRHWEFRFKDAGGSVMYVPLLDNSDVPNTEALIDFWINLVKNPPIQCNEQYVFNEKELLIRQQFPNAVVSPIPPVMGLYGERKNLLKLPEGMVQLFKTLWGPFNIVEGDHFDLKIATDWMEMGFEPTRKIKGDLAPIPEELVYAGDYSWDPEHSAMDKLLTLRTWAPLVNYMPKKIKSELLKQLKVPSYVDFKNSLAVITEPVTKISWAKDKKLFEHQGDITFDIDWYNGLALSGLERAVQCQEKSISEPAKKLAFASKQERLLMINFYQLFHEWFIGAAWNDSRGWLMDLDCSHNGIEGLLAEARLRELEGDKSGAEFVRYIAAKTAVFHLSTMYLRNWRLPLEHGFVADGEPGYGIKNFHAWTELGKGTTASDKKQYFLATEFPEFAALHKKYGPVERLDSLANEWKTSHPERYIDWQFFYLGSDFEKQFKENKYAQEARIQAAVFYGTSPEIFLRLWILDQSADEIEALYKTPLSLSQQLHLRLGTKLVKKEW